MAETTMTSDVRMLLDRDPFDDRAVADLLEALMRDPSRYRTLRDAASAMAEKHKGEPAKPLVHLRLGVADVLLGRPAQGIEHLKKAGDSGMAHYFRGLALESAQHWAEAAKAFSAAAELNYQPEKSQLKRAGALRLSGDAAKAKELLESLEKSAGRIAEYHYQKGALLVDEGETGAASDEFEQALKLEKDHSMALFQLAYLNDRSGNDEEARQLYKRCIQRPPVPLAALINLGVLYEDNNEYREAESCYKRVLEAEPNHGRARLFMKDCKASKDQYYDEGEQERFNKMRHILETPVTDFELSVRSRNCLRKMNIRTLWDLTRTTEAQLLSSKNFGETSLTEIKEMMTSKGLRLGMALEAGERLQQSPQGGGGGIAEELTPEIRAVLSKPITDLSLSVRARKCMSKLGVSTLGDIVTYTGDQLLECKNFGVTSLNEVREKLAQYDLKLKGE